MRYESRFALGSTRWLSCFGPMYGFQTDPRCYFCTWLVLAKKLQLVALHFLWLLFVILHSFSRVPSWHIIAVYIPRVRFDYVLDQRYSFFMWCFSCKLQILTFNLNSLYVVPVIHRLLHVHVVFFWPSIVCSNMQQSLVCCTRANSHATIFYNRIARTSREGCIALIHTQLFILALSFSITGAGSLTPIWKFVVLSFLNIGSHSCLRYTNSQFGAVQQADHKIVFLRKPTVFGKVRAVFLFNNDQNMFLSHKNTENSSSLGDAECELVLSTPFSRSN